jgi:hypothetical protein
MRTPPLQPFPALVPEFGRQKITDTKAHFRSVVENGRRPDYPGMRRIHQ